MAVLVGGVFRVGAFNVLGMLWVISVTVCANKKNLSGAFWYSEITVQLIERRQ